MRKYWIIAAGVFIILIAGLYIGSPYLAARSFIAAARSGDTDDLEAAVDFPAVRQSLKAQMTAMVSAKMSKRPRNGA